MSGLQSFLIALGAFAAMFAVAGWIALFSWLVAQDGRLRFLALPAVFIPLFFFMWALLWVLNS